MLLHLIEQFQRGFLSAQIQTVCYLLAVLALLAAFGSVAVLRSGNSYTTQRKLSNLHRIGLSSSNIDDQYDAKYSFPDGTAHNSLVHIKAIFTHPVESCAPIEVRSAVLTKADLLYDRAFSFATDATLQSVDKGPVLQFISQRTKPKMSIIKTELWLPRPRSEKTDPLVETAGCLVLSFPDPDPPSLIQRLQILIELGTLKAKPQFFFIVPLLPTPHLVEKFGLKMKIFSVHSREARGIDMGCILSIPAALPKIKRFLGYSERRTLTLFRCTPETLTRTEKNLALLRTLARQRYTAIQTSSLLT